MGGNNTKTFHVDGSGQRPDGTGSRYAWVWLGTNKQRIRCQDQLTNNQAEYEALLAVLKYVAVGSHVEVLTDSLLVSEQFNRRWAVNNSELARLLCTARELIDDKGLHVEVKWIPRARNLAGKLLEMKAQTRKVG